MIGVGNRLRADDAAGLDVIERLRGTLPEAVELVEHETEPTVLIDAWQPQDAVWLVDSASSGAAPGTIHRIDLATEELPAGLFRASTHHFGLAETIELARAIDRLPARLVVYAVEGGRFDLHEGVTPAVHDAVERAAVAVREEVVGCMSGP